MPNKTITVTDLFMKNCKRKDSIVYQGVKKNSISPIPMLLIEHDDNHMLIIDSVGSIQGIMPKDMISKKSLKPYELP